MQTFNKSIPHNHKEQIKQTSQEITLVEEAKKYALGIVEKYCKHYFFHNISHTQSVFDRSTYLAMTEWINGEDLEDLQIAAIFHDTGFSVQYAKNEFAWSQIARKWLETKNHPEKRIQKIEEIIMATVLFSKPKNILQEIIQDADLDNIGTKEGFKNSQNVLREYREIAHVDISECTFWQFSYKVYKHYQFHTKTARSEREYQKNLNLKLLEAYCNALECEIPYWYDHVERIV